MSDQPAPSGKAAGWLRRMVPPRVAPHLARWVVRRRWPDPAFREIAESEMHFLLEHTDRAAEVPAIARRWAEHMQLRSVLRWHPRAITRQEVRGIEWLTTERDPDRGIVLSFMHHHLYEGIFLSLRRRGVDLTTVTAQRIVDAPPGSTEHQTSALVAMGSRSVVRVGAGLPEMAERLEQGEIVVVAADYIGQTEMSYLGRSVLGGSGAARLAMMTNSPVVHITVERDDQARPYLQLHKGLEPSDFAGPMELLAEIQRRHEPAVLAWPEAVDRPTLRFHVPPTS
jgi:lauroyl/myristoyl acyltransferase